MSKKLNELEAPVTYQGGKSRIANKIWDIIKSRNELQHKEFYDLCCGSGSISIQAINEKLPFIKINMIDFSVWGDFWESIGNNTFNLQHFQDYIKSIPKEKENIQKFLEDLSRKNPFNETPLSHVYCYLVLQAGSFGGKQIWLKEQTWKNNSFRSYWMPTETSSRRSPVNPMMPMPETLFDRIKLVQDKMNGKVHGKNENIENLEINLENAIIYIDPPYAKTTKYKNEFDILKLVKRIKTNDNKIYVSEQMPLSHNSFLISDNRAKGSISGGSKGVQEWLSEF